MSHHAVTAAVKMCALLEEYEDRTVARLVGRIREVDLNKNSARATKGGETGRRRCGKR